MTPGNLITLARLIATPVIVWLILRGDTTWAFWLFAAAAVSDAVDGFLARRLGHVSVLGAYLDPLADKVLLAAVYIALARLEALPLWVVILVVSRDILIIGGVLLLWLLERSVNIKALMISKVNTVAQIALAAVALGQPALAVTLAGVVDVLAYLVAATTLLSGAGYLVQWTRHAARIESQG